MEYLGRIRRPKDLLKREILCGVEERRFGPRLLAIATDPWPRGPCMGVFVQGEVHK